MGRKRFVSIDNFSGGLNEQINATRLNDNELSISYDASYRDGGTCVRPQYKLFGDVTCFGETDGYALGKRSFAAFEYSNESFVFAGLSIEGSYVVLRCGTIALNSGLSFSIGNTIKHTCGDAAGAFQHIKKYSISGTDYFIFHDYGNKRLKKGTIGSSPTVTTFGPDEDREESLFEVFAGRLFYTDSANPGRVLYSEIDSESYSGYIDIEGRENIVALLSSNDILYVFGENNIHAITGRSALSFSTKMRIKNVYARQAVDWNGRVIFKNEYGEIFIWDGYGHPIELSKNIKATYYQNSVFNVFNDRLFCNPSSQSSSIYDGSLNEPHLLVYDLSMLNRGIAPASIWRIPGGDSTDEAINYMHGRFLTSPRKDVDYSGTEKRYRIGFFENDSIINSFFPESEEDGLKNILGYKENNYDHTSKSNKITGSSSDFTPLSYTIYDHEINTQIKTKKFSFGSIQGDKRIYRVYNHTNGSGTYSITVDVSGINNEKSYDDTYTVTITGSNEEYVKNVDCETGNLYGRFVAITSGLSNGEAKTTKGDFPEKQSIDGITIEIDTEAP